MKKIILWILIMTFMLSCFAGCGKTDPDPSQSTSQNETNPPPTTGGTDSGDGQKEPLIELPDVDYEDYNFRILMRDNTVHQSDMFAEEDSADAVSNAVYVRNMALYEKHGVQLSLSRLPAGNNGEAGIQQVLGGEDSYDLIATHGRIAMSYAMNGILVDWNDLPYLNLSHEWWAQGARESFTFNDTLFFMTGDLSHLSMAASYVSVFNKDILRANGIEFPYQAVKDGTWTFEKMREIALQCASDMDDDGFCSLDSQSDILGYVTYPWGGTYCAFFASGSRIVSRDENGLPIVTIANERAYDAMVKFFELATSNSCHLDTNDGNAKVNPAMIENRIVFYDSPLNDVVLNFRKTDLNYGIVPYPKTAEVGSYSSHVAGAFNLFMIPNSSTELSRTAVVLEALAQFGNRYVMPVYYESVVEVNSVRDEESYEMLSIISDSRLYDFGYYDGQLTGITNLLEQLAKKKRSAGEFYSLYNTNIGDAEQHLADLLVQFGKA